MSAWPALGSQERRRLGAHPTPPAVARYLAEASLGRWLWRGPVPAPEELADRTALEAWPWRATAEVAALRVLDPACGDGALLEAALDCLEAWHRARALVEGGTAEVDAASARPLREVLAEAHLCGLDVDAVAAAAARDRLPGARIQTGNALIWPGLVPADAVQGAAPEQSHAGWANSELRGTRPTMPDPWDPAGPDGFPDVMAAGGFDLIIANPPYVFGEHLPPAETDAFRVAYELGRGQVDLFKLFYERTLRDLLRPGGLHAFLVPDALLARDEHAELRAWLAAHAAIERICHLGRVFPGAGVGVVAVVCRRTTSPAAGLAVPGLAIPGRLMPAAPELPGLAIPGRLMPAAPELPGLAPPAGLATPGADGPCVIDRWDVRRSRCVAADELPSRRALVALDGAPWCVAAPAGWFGVRGLGQRLTQGGATLGELLLPGADGATRGEELGRRDLGQCPAAGVPAPGCVAVYAGEDVRRHLVRAPLRQLPSEAIAKPGSVYRAPRILVVKTGAGPVAAACGDKLPVLQSVYVFHLSPPWRRALGDDAEDAIAALISSALLTSYAYYRWTAGKALQPQLTLANLRALPVPAIGGTRAGGDGPVQALAIAGQGAAALRHELSVAGDGSGSVPDAVARLERSVDDAIAAAFGLHLDDWLEVLAPALDALPPSQRPRWWGRNLG